MSSIWPLVGLAVIVPMLLWLRQNMIVVLGLSSAWLYYFYSNGAIGYTAIDAWQIARNENFLAIPLYVLAGNVMANGSIASRLVRVMAALTAPIPGGLALAAVFTLAGELVFFTAVFELVLRGFFTSCLLAVAAYASFQDTSHLQMNCGHRLICVKTHIFDLLGASGLQLRDPVRAQIVATEQP